MSKRRKHKSRSSSQATVGKKHESQGIDNEKVRWAIDLLVAIAAILTGLGISNIKEFMNTTIMRFYYTNTWALLVTAICLVVACYTAVSLFKKLQITLINLLVGIAGGKVPNKKEEDCKARSWLAIVMYLGSMSLVYEHVTSYIEVSNQVLNGLGVAPQVVTAGNYVSIAFIMLAVVMSLVMLYYMLAKNVHWVNVMTYYRYVAFPIIIVEAVLIVAIWIVNAWLY